MVSVNWMMFLPAAAAAACWRSCLESFIAAAASFCFEVFLKSAYCLRIHRQTWGYWVIDDEYTLIDDEYVSCVDKLLNIIITDHFLSVQSIYYLIYLSTHLSTSMTYFFCISRIQEPTALTNVFMSSWGDMSCKSWTSSSHGEERRDRHINIVSCSSYTQL